MQATKWFQLNKMGGFGDLVMMTALFKPLKDCGYKLRVVVSDYYGDILEGHPDIDHYVRLPEEKYWELRNTFDSDLWADLTYPAGWGNLPFPKITEHMITRWHTECGLVDLGDKPTLPQYKTKLQKQYRIAFQTKSGWSPYKDWPMSYWEELIRMIRDEFPEIEFDHLGTNRCGIPGVYERAGFSLKLQLQTLDQSILFIGPDSVFQHAAKALDTQAIVIWGSTNPEAFGYESHINLKSHVPCSPCYREYSHIEAGNACPSTIISTIDGTTKAVCHAVITPKDVFRHVQKILRGN